ncbi:CRP-like cAMP-binding protein [Sphingomonas zeicaulis]|uniref:Crp/Fnr family transcriptional regulator n=1 Tax=Sphingomonas zeicaulis TaxID=1632740 RepID=UPI003D1B0955
MLTKQSPMDGAALNRAVDLLCRHTALSDHERDALLSLPFTLTSVEKGEYISVEDEPARRCAIVISGFLARHKTTSRGARQIVNLSLAGDWVDLPNSVMQVADHSVQALTPATVAFIAREDILAVATEHAALLKALWVESMIDASITRTWLVNVGKQSARARVAHLICEVHERERNVSLVPPNEVLFPFTQEEIGDMTGMTNVHANRTLQGLKADGLIANRGRDLIILDWQQLYHVAGFDRRYLHRNVHLQW